MEFLEATLNTITSLWSQLAAAPAHLLVLVVLLALGVMIKISPVPNPWIPWVLMGVGTVLYPQLASPSAVHPDLRNPTVVLAIFGFLLAVGSIVLHMLLRKIEKFREMEAAIVNRFTQVETKFITKAEVERKP